MGCAEKSYTLARIQLVPHVPEDVIDPGQLTGILGRHKAFGRKRETGNSTTALFVRKSPPGRNIASIPENARA